MGVRSLTHLFKIASVPLALCVAFFGRQVWAQTIAPASYSAEALLLGWESNYASLSSMQVEYVHHTLSALSLHGTPMTLAPREWEHAQRIELGTHYHEKR